MIDLLFSQYQPITLSNDIVTVIVVNMLTAPQN